MLATLDAGREVDEHDPSVRQFAEMLDALQETCTDRRLSISDFAVKSQELLKDAGRSVSLSDVLAQVEASIPAGSPAMPCADVFAAWVVLEESTG